MRWDPEYAQSEPTFPQSRKILAKIPKGMPDDEQAEIVDGSTVRVYHFDVVKLTVTR